MIKLRMFFIIYEKALDLVEKKEYDGAADKFESLLEMLENNKNVIEDYEELKESINNNIAGCKLFMKGL
ncbi:hypothetical protein [Brachyspira hyodysenteriae]|uniref:hypothetical protein n=1 Tax=Brachyspira hyodysenteriae TaxID=159 RepID=UPI00063DAE33|nr:hypothetical protein [Brachyspira hyodysenteriae]KLI18268.1 hypothetical protein SU45_02950 [Brachyspira hyodysenteriae]KLI22334.1 hypothetical protein SU43_08465 [Brachyspira hyodysenteriae]KLI62694.1 hypothetical protein SZ46_00685 [Brachyspira hyodysenteriae]TVL62704.1 hypothetical protein A9X85_00510 [Brachyspira hyodysenteriae]TVL80395.1 hypothetical protein A9X82_02150 [Brachyspira hyodysenteriae]